MARILIIDDDTDLSHALQLGLEESGHLVTCLDRAEHGSAYLAKEEIDVVFIDNKMPGISGIDSLASLQKHGVPVILMTGHAATDTAIQAMNLGAFDYVLKPIDYQELLDKLKPLIGEAVRLSKPGPAVQISGELVGADAHGPVLQGTSKGMLEIYKLIGRFAKADDAVLILGETGTGKELVARAIHTYSPRKLKPFVALNCTALNENLLDDELFGHEAGAFTNAAKLRKGKFEHADGGTLFLDEVGDMPLPLQAKLLRVLENREVCRIGSNDTIKVNVRLVSATHRDLEAAIQEGEFRQDLFYRLKGLRISLPPLRERGPDLELLARHFLARAAADAGVPVPTLTDAALQKLKGHPWPGNIRELRNVICTAVGMCRGPQVLPAHLDIQSSSAQPPEDQGDQDGLASMSALIRWAWRSGQQPLFPLLHDLLERELLRFALAELNGNQTKVAERLGMARGTVISRTQKYGLK